MCIRKAFIIAVAFLSIIISCKNIPQSRLSVEGLPSSEGEFAIESTRVIDGALFLYGQGFSARISPWPTFHFPTGNYRLSVKSLFFPDGPVRVLDISDEDGLLAIIGLKVRENSVVAGSYRLKSGAALKQSSGGRLWTEILLYDNAGAEIRLAPGESASIAAEGIALRFYLVAASVKDPAVKRPEINDEEPGFIADYVLIYM